MNETDFEESEMADFIVTVVSSQLLLLYNFNI